LPWKQNDLHTAPADPEIIAIRTTRAKSKRIAVTVSKNEHAESKKIDVKTKNKPNKKVADSKSKKIAVTVFI
jgi:helix-turn-helix protein